MKAPCAVCYNRREVTMHTDGKLYCEECHPKKVNPIKDFLRM